MHVYMYVCVYVDIYFAQGLKNRCDDQGVAGSIRMQGD